MKAIKCTVFVISAVIIVCTLCSCSVRRPVKIIQNNPPETKKPIGTSVPAPEITPSQSYISAKTGDESITLTTPEGTIEVEYSYIEEYIYMQEWNYEEDKLISGDETDQYISGKMLAGEDEEYSLHIHKAVKKYIAIYYKGQQLIFNLSSAEATENCYNAIKSHMS